MTAPSPGSPGREGPADAATGRGTGPVLATILVAGLVARLIMAYAWEPLRGSGFGNDLELFRYWAEMLARVGPAGFYASASYADYTPGYLYVLWLVGIVGELAGGIGDLIKLPAILADVALAWLVAVMVRDLGAGTRRAALAGAVVVLNPVTWFDSVIWGQVDSVGTVVLLLAVRELWRGRGERAAILAVVAALVKPQLAILVPIVAAVTIRRALAPAGGWGAEERPPTADEPLLRRVPPALRIVTTGAAGFLTAVALAAPFGLTVIAVSAAAPFVDSSLVRLMLSTAAQYPYLSVNAYNLWALLPVDGSSLASSGGWIADAPIPGATSWGTVAGIPAGAVGAALLLGTAAAIALVVARRPDRTTILVGTAALALAFFALPTRVHERYLFPFFGLAAILLAVAPRWRIAYAAASVATFLNMYVVLTTIYPGNPSVSDWIGIGGLVRSYEGVAAIAILHTAVFAWGLLQLRATTTARLRAAFAPPRSGAGTAAVPRAPGAEAGLGAAGASLGAAAASAPVPATAPAARVPALPRRVPGWFDRPSLGELGPVGWLLARIRETPTVPDRSAALRHERPGRLDRLDLWFLVVLLVATAGLRTFRLAEPGRMHFDEVYHARTATEFLQDWRYGIDHAIYEWTHPHLAKYGMAAGIVAFAGHDVAASSQLGIPVVDAAVEPRREPAAGSPAPARDGDRLWIATGDAVVAFDLATRERLGAHELRGATAVAWDPAGRLVWAGTAAGELLALHGPTLDLAPAAFEPIATLDGSVRRVVPFSGGQRIGVLLPDDRIVVVDPGSGLVTGELVVPGAADLVAAGDGDALLAVPAEVVDPASVAAALERIAGAERAAIVDALARVDEPLVILDVQLEGEARTELRAALDAGELPGLRIEPTPLLAVAGSEGIDLVSGAATRVARVELAGGAAAAALVSGIDDGAHLHAAHVNPVSGVPEIVVVAVRGEQARDGAVIVGTYPLPGEASRVAYDDAAELVHVLGVAPDGSGTTVYVVEPHGRAVFADHRLPFVPAAWAVDHDEAWPTSSRGELLAFEAGGGAVALDVASYQFAWRLPGVLLGTLTAAAVFLLARILFARRTVGVLAGLLVLADGMFFVQSRIAMNDVYTGTFILAAYALFAWLWIERRGWRWFWLLMPVIGLLLGLALAAKWVAAYAIGALGILVLVRSALGRLLLVAALVGLTGVLGWMALAVPPDSGASGNLVFALVMIGLTLAASAIAVYHPVAWSDDEVRLVVAGPPAAGLLVALTAVALGVVERTVALGPLLVSPLTVGFALVVAGPVAHLLLAVAGRIGIGPLSRGPALPAGVTAPPAEGWLRPGALLGLPLAWIAACLVVLPVGVYVLSYVPWALVEGHQLLDGWPEGSTGQTLLALTGDMYRYHNNLTAAHAASSPWWAWPLNLKPVWFYQGSFAGGTAAAIYDAGSVVVWWLGVPALGFVAYQAFRRRSLALALVVIAFLAQWISWARIDRAAFQYHYYTALPFVVLALAYLLAEVWHGASRRTWLLVRVAAALAVLGPVLLWLLRLPLCGIANVEAVSPGSQACNGNPGTLELTPAAAVLAATAVVTVLVVARLLAGLARRREPGGPLDLLPVVAAAGIGAGAIAFARGLPAEAPFLVVPGLVPELIALAVAIPLGLVAVQVLTARDGRRFVAGCLAAAAAWFVVLYPNISALPLPATIVNAYQGLLPTYLYPFQFGVNTVDRSGAISFADPRFAVLLAFLAIATLVVAYSAWVWREAIADEPGDGPGSAAAAARGTAAG